jgi:hypothetical protein
MQLGHAHTPLAEAFGRKADFKVICFYLYSSPSIIRIIKSRRMRRAGHVARMGRRGTRIDYWWESQRERDH